MDTTVVDLDNLGPPRDKDHSRLPEVLAAETSLLWSDHSTNRDNSFQMSEYSREPISPKSPVSPNSLYVNAPNNNNNAASFEKRKERNATKMMLDMQEQIRQIQEDVGQLLHETGHHVQQDSRVLGSLMKSVLEQMRLQHSEQMEMLDVLTQRLDEAPGPGYIDKRSKRGAKTSPSKRSDDDNERAEEDVMVTLRECTIESDDSTRVVTSLGKKQVARTSPTVGTTITPITTQEDAYPRRLSTPMQTLNTMDMAATTGSQGIDIELIGDSLFDAVGNCDLGRVSNMLHAGSDPNESRPHFTYKHHEFSPCSILPLAVMTGDMAIVRKLVESGAQLTSEYGQLVGALKMQWSGSAVFAVIPHGNLTQLRQLLELQADPHARSTNDANLVWQSCYYGRLDILKYLLQSVNVDFHIAAGSEDFEGVSYTSLHIAARQGRPDCIKLLLSASAEMDTLNEWNFSPLDDAILEGRSAVVLLLVSQGAGLTASKFIVETSIRSSRRVSQDSGAASSPSTTRQMLKREKHSFQDIPTGSMRALDLLFGFGNAVVIAAAAEGLQSQEDQMKALTTNELVRFLETPGAAAENIIKAMFWKRDVVVMHDSGGGVAASKWHITAAHIRKPELLPNGIRSEFFNVADVNDCTYSDLRLQVLRKEKVSQSTYRFFERLAPQVGKDSTLLCTVSLYEGVVAGMHKDLKMIKAIADLDQEHFQYRPCQVIIEACWKETRLQAAFEALTHILLMANFLALGVILRPPNPQWQEFYIFCLAAGGGMIWSFIMLSEVLQMVAMQQQGWFKEYLRSFVTYVDWFRISADGCCLFYIWRYGLDVIENSVFLCMFSLCAFWKWLMILHALLPFRIVGMPIIPIIRTMTDVGPFMTVLAFHIFGIFHGYTSLSVPDINMFQSLILVYRLGVMGDANPKELDGGDPNYYYVTRIFFFVIVFSVAVTLMNMFVAALSNSYTINSDKMEVLYQHHRADRVLTYMGIRQGFRKFFGKKQVHDDRRLSGRGRLSNGSPGQKSGHRSSLWYCCCDDNGIDDP